MNGRDFPTGIRSVDGDWRPIWGARTGARRIARLKAVPPAARMGVKRAVSLDLDQCRAAGGVPLMLAKWQLSSRPSARHLLDHDASV